jgi:probable 2-oxoglutarate dehydrogenase E1 component DHKTD1
MPVCPVTLVNSVSKVAACTLADMDTGTEFLPVLADPSVAAGSLLDRVIVVSGKIYYDLVRERKARGLDGSVAIVRIEEMAPFPFMALEDVLRSCVSTGGEVRWVQEEARNQGAWSHVECRANEVLKELDGGLRLKYVGRRESPVPAVGVGNWHKAESAKLFDDAFV